MMRQLLVSTINLLTCVGISNLKTAIWNARLVQFQWNVVNLYDKITADYLLIGELNGRYENMVLDTYTALLSGKNKAFNSYIQQGKDEWELGQDKKN